MSFATLSNSQDSGDSVHASGSDLVGMEVVPRLLPSAVSPEQLPCPWEQRPGSDALPHMPESSSCFSGAVRPDSKLPFALTMLLLPTVCRAVFDGVGQPDKLLTRCKNRPYVVDQ